MKLKGLQKTMLDRASPKLLVPLSSGNAMAIEAARALEHEGLIVLDSSHGKVATYVITYKGAALRRERT